MAKLLFIALAISILLPASALSQVQAAAALQPTRTVKKRVLKSGEMPVVELKFGKDFKYAGGHRFILYGVADAEQHFFVDADKGGRVKRMYWVQFEGYLPSNTHSYNYKSPKTVNISGLDFFADAYARNIKTSTGRPDSDGNRARAFLEMKGYRLGSDEIISQRLVHLIDKEKRNELMIIYLEDMSGLGLTAADFATGGKASAKWNEVSEALLSRALKDLKVVR